MSARGRPWVWWLVVALLAGVLPAAVLTLRRGADAHGSGSSVPPPAEGWFRTLPAGAWSSLPDDRACAGRTHRSQWEPRPGNRSPNHHVPDPASVRAAFAARPRSSEGAVDPRWDSWLLPRVSGQHVGTTDENIQWAACKWGLSDNLLRAIAFRESNWWQGEVYSSGRCVEQNGCGDVLTESTVATRQFCDGLAEHGVDYQRWYGVGRCPRTFSLVGVMSWQAPDWGPMPDNQNGTFPFNRDSTAFARDYLGAFLRGCDEGWARWLVPPESRGNAGSTERLWGCVGAWYAGAWRTPEARQYIDLVRTAMDDRPWLDHDWAGQRPPCTDHGCPRGMP